MGAATPSRAAAAASTSGTPQKRKKAAAPAAGALSVKEGRRAVGQGEEDALESERQSGIAQVHKGETLCIKKILLCDDKPHLHKGETRCKKDAQADDCRFLQETSRVGTHQTRPSFPEHEHSLKQDQAWYTSHQELFLKLNLQCHRRLWPNSSLSGCPTCHIPSREGSRRDIQPASTTSPLENVGSTTSFPLRRKSVLSSVSGGTDHGSQVQEKGGKDVELRFNSSEGTPAKFASTPVRLMAATPSLHTPKRPMSATVCETPPLKMAKRSDMAKLFMKPTKDATSVEEENQSTRTSAVDADDELLSFLRKSLLQSVKQKEKRALQEKETGFANQVQRQKLISSLPSTFDIIFLIYQSRQRSVLNKQELVDNIIDRNPKIVDKAEIEEQLRLLKVFVPEWISEKTAISGDVLCCVDTLLSQSEIRQRLNGVE